ncbi:hypothetical protein [Pseudonocardia sp. NPDC049635]|uniref:hypothetical protein n=1 Tax=Pseudonocardia sp. NPDC049635 TaxID=3155506 RepID=UPI0033D6E82B
MTDTITVRRALGVAAAAGTLPYLFLKIAWLTGNPVGIDDPGLLQQDAWVAANTVTLLLALCVAGLAAVFGSRWARRAPAVVVLLPAWIATGLLVPAAVVAPLALLTPAAPGGGLAGWVTPMVYGGFAWQGFFLLAAFALFARDRWWTAAVTAGPVPEQVRPLLGATTGGGAAAGTLSALLHLADAAGSASLTGVVVGAVQAVLVAAGVAGVLALAVGRSGPVAVIAAWTGTAVPFAGGLWATASAVGIAGAGNAAALRGFADLTGLLGGFALAVAALLTTLSYTISTPAHRNPAVNG